MSPLLHDGTSVEDIIDGLILKSKSFLLEPKRSLL